MRPAKVGDTVRVHYRAMLDDGSVFDETYDQAPLRFTIGGGQLIPGFEKAVVGMKPGDSKKTELPADEAFGPYHEDMVAVVPRSSFAESAVEPEVGESLPLQTPDGPPVEVTITEITESTVTVDANHPLAGEDLSLDIELVEIVYGPH